jgi:hypothetical protein
LELVEVDLWVFEDKVEVDIECGLVVEVLVEVDL